MLKSNNRNSTTNHGPISLCLPCLEKWKIILSGSDIVVLVIKKKNYLKKRAQFGYIYMSLKGVPNICYLRMGGWESLCSKVNSPKIHLNCTLIYLWFIIPWQAITACSYQYKMILQNIHTILICCSKASFYSASQPASTLIQFIEPHKFWHWL